MCIGKLDADIKSKYEALAIFSEDVNIMPQVLINIANNNEITIVNSM